MHTQDSENTQCEETTKNLLFPLCHSSVCILPVLLSDAETGDYFSSIFFFWESQCHKYFLIKELWIWRFYQLGATERLHSLVSLFQPIIVKMVSGKWILVNIEPKCRNKFFSIFMVLLFLFIQSWNQFHIYFIISFIVWFMQRTAFRTQLTKIEPKAQYRVSLVHVWPWGTV